MWALSDSTWELPAWCLHDPMLHNGEHKGLPHLNHFGVQALSQLTAPVSHQNRAVQVDVDQSGGLGETTIAPVWKPRRAECCGFTRDCWTNHFLWFNQPLVSHCGYESRSQPLARYPGSETINLGVRMCAFPLPPSSASVSSGPQPGPCFTVLSLT